MGMLETLVTPLQTHVGRAPLSPRGWRHAPNSQPRGDETKPPAFLIDRGLRCVRVVRLFKRICCDTR